MTQYCRYCEHAYRSQFVIACEKTEKYMTRLKAKHTNKCPHFQYNPVDVLRENVKGYKPTGRKIVQYGGLGEQITMKELLEG